MSKPAIEETSSAEYVAPLLPPTAPTPEPAKRIGFIRALLTYWIVPGRVGPHLAVASIYRALAAHVLAAIATLVILSGPILVEFLSEWLEYGRPVDTLHDLREAMAARILDVVATSTFVGYGSLPILVILAIVPVVQLFVLLVGTLSMPWAAGGDRASSVWKRAVKNAYWSTTYFVPAATLWFVLQLVDWERMYRFDMALIVVTVVATGIVVIGYGRCLFLGSGRFVGEPDGPAFAPREPLCDQCGYAIVHLPLETRCPECGLPVKNSLPGGRRRPTTWHEHELRPSGIRELIRMQWTANRDADFFRRLPVQSGLPTARHFWWATFGLMLFVGLILANIGMRIMLARTSAWEVVAVTGPVLLALATVFVIQVLGMFPACLWAQHRHGIRDYRVSATVCYFASPLLWPVTLIALVAAFVLPVTAVGWPELGELVVYKTAGQEFTILHVLIGLVGLVILAFIIRWVRRLSAAFEAVRYANV